MNRYLSASSFCHYDTTLYLIFDAVVEVICLESEALFTLIEQVVLRLQEKQGEKADKWIGHEEAMRLLRIKSKTTLQKLRDEGKIKFSQPQRKIILYDRESIEAFLEKHARHLF